MHRHFRYVVRIRGDRDRQLMVAGLILALICLALYINLTIMLSKPSSDRIPKPIRNETNETTNSLLSTTSPNVPYIPTAKGSITNSVQSVSSTTVGNQIEKYINYSLTPPLKYETFGHLLDKTLYYNLLQFCFVNGYVSSVSLRLFSKWKGNAPLYVFVIWSDTIVYKIRSRYAVHPQRDTTEWQTIDIPAHVLPIGLGNLLAIGMQDNSNSANQIHAINLLFGIRGANISENTTIFTSYSDRHTGVAMSYTVIYYVQTTSIISITVY